MMFVRWWFRCLIVGLAFQKLFFFLFLLEFFWAFGIHPLHLLFLFRRQLWQMADKVNQLPTVFAVLTHLAPGGHAGQTNAVWIV